MGISVIVLVLLATLTFVVVGVGVLVGERSRRASLAFSITHGRTSRFQRLRGRLEKGLLRTRGGRRLRRTLDNADLGWRLGDEPLVAEFALPALNLAPQFLTALLETLGDDRGV